MRGVDFDDQSRPMHSYLTYTHTRTVCVALVSRATKKSKTERLAL